MFNFVLTTAKIIESGSVVRSKYATAGPYHTATPDGIGDFVVFDDVTGDIHRYSAAVGAAHKWNEINLRNIRSSYA